MTIRISDAESEFIEQLGLMAEGDSRPRILGRIWGLLIIIGEPITAGSITEILQVSRASVSTNLRLLEMLRIVSRESKPGERESYFALATDAYEAVLKDSLERRKKNRQIVESFVARVERKCAKRSLRQFADFHHILETHGREALKELKNKP